MVSGVTTNICLMQCDTSHSYRVVECCPTPLQWLYEVIGGNWNILSDPEHPKHAQWVTCLVNMQAMEELGQFQLPGIVYRSLRHGAVYYYAET